MSEWENSPKVPKQMSQSALKAMHQLRHVLRTNKSSAMALDLFLFLKYLPIKFSSALFFSQDTTTPPPPKQITDENAKKEENKSPLKKMKQLPLVQVTPLGTPVKTVIITPAPPPPPPISQGIPSSVLRNVLQINTLNNKVIESKKLAEMTRDDLLTQEVKGQKQQQQRSAEGHQGQEGEEGRPKNKKKSEEVSQFLENTMHWQNIESRTKYLVMSLQKSALPTSNSQHHLITHLDELFSHIYQHHETRNTAIEAGALKVLIKVLKTHPDSYIVHRTREILALLGNNPPTKGQGIKILAIDGGGVRGLVALEVLRVIERITGKRTYELFDYICGVSTGSILAFLLGAHKKTLDEAELLYKDLSQEIFSQNSFLGNAALLWNHSYYHTPTFEKILKKHCGEQPLITLARDPQLPRVSAISTVVNQERVYPYVFRTYAMPPNIRAKYIGGCRYLMWEAVRASAAAPTYFEEIKLGNYLHQDGGVLCNNPTSVAISEARTLWKDVPLQCVVSLGTGLTLSSRTDRNLNDLIETGKEGMSYLSWKGKFLKVLDSATDTEGVHNTLNELLAHTIYFRFNPYLSEIVRLDEASSAKLEQVQMETRAYLERNVEKVEFACKKLVEEKGMSKRVADWWYHA